MIFILSVSLSASFLFNVFLWSYSDYLKRRCEHLETVDRLRSEFLDAVTTDIQTTMLKKKLVDR